MGHYRSQLAPGTQFGSYSTNLVVTATVLTTGSRSTLATMTTFLALVLVLVFLDVAATTYVRHNRSESVQRLWASPYRYDYFRP